MLSINSEYPSYLLYQFDPSIDTAERTGYYYNKGEMKDFYSFVRKPRMDYTNPNYLGMIMRDHYNTESPPICYMFVGLPCSGKSTFYDTQFLNGYFKYSTDAELERIAEREGLTYNDTFLKYFKEAEKAANSNLENAMRNYRPIVWDQTCVNKTSRASKLARLKPKYMKIAIAFHCPWEQILIRNENRQGKHIPLEVLESMARKFEVPTTKEGFDAVFHIDGTKII